MDTKPATSTDTNSTSKQSGQPPSRMHNAGHNFYKTVCPVKCELADEWAAQRLISPREFLNAARSHRTIDGVARELWATPGIVRAYIDHLSVKDWATMKRLVGHELQ
ncbi:hypothetical protein CGK93_13955 [Arthrobacter sp. YN]|nr:hypothetical protein CGK93_13955 [Arthrobacter sp. YN]